MTEQRIEFRNRRGQRLVGVLHDPVGEAMVISCHGMFSNKGGTKHTLLGELLARHGLGMLRFDFAGRGESDGSLFDLSYSDRVEDLDAAIAHLAGLGVRRFGLFGSSMGGAVALLAAARDERVVAIATLAAVGHPETLAEQHPEYARAWLERGVLETPDGPIGRRFYDDSLSHDVISAVRMLRAPVLIFHGLDDDTVPVSDAHDIAAAARNASLELVDGAGHRFDNPTHLRPAMQQIAAFLAGELKKQGTV